MSDSDPLVIVGGGAGGLSVARSYRDAGGPAEVILLAEEGVAPYQRPPLSKDFLRGETDRDELWLEQPGWYEEQRITLRPARAQALDPTARQLRLDSGELLVYGSCALACGSRALRPDIPGLDDPAVLALRSLQDAEDLATRTCAPGTRVVVIGSGFVGCEAAASLSMRGATTTLVTDEEQPHAARLGPEVGERIAGWLRDAGVELALGAGVERLERGDEGVEVVVAGGRRIAAQVVLAALGAQARVELAEEAGLELALGGVAVDASMRTSAPAVWAVGDIAAAEHPGAGRPIRVEHWGDALTQGEVAGRVMAGQDAAWDSAPGFWSTIGTHTLKYAAWGDGHDVVRFEPSASSAFAVSYERAGQLVGALAHEHDEHYEQGRRRLEHGG